MENGTTDSFMTTSHPISDTISQWLEDLNADRAATTVARYASVLDRFTKWYETETRTSLVLGDMNPIVLVGYRNYLQQTEQPSTVNIHVSALRSWGKWLKQCRLVEEDPCVRLKLVKRQSPSAPRSLLPN